MNYREKSYEEIFEVALNNCLEKGLISHADEFMSYINNHEDISNYYVMDKSVMSVLGALFYKYGLTPTYESAKVEYAGGFDLEDIGKIAGIKRPAAIHAEVDCTFALKDPIDEDVEIPAGIIVSTTNGLIQYKTIEDIFIATGETETTVSARAVIGGVSSNIIEHSISKIVSELEYNLSVTNNKPSTSGREAYTDDEYRYLIMNHRKIEIKGSNEAFEEYLANFDGLDSYNLVPNWDGSGTVKVIMDPGTPEQLHRAYDDLQNKVSQTSQDIVMCAADKKTINIYAVVNVDIDQINPYSEIEKENIKARLISCIKTFIDGGYMNNGRWYPGLYLGEDFIPHKLAVFLDIEVPELKNIEFNYPTGYVKISDEEVGVSNNITIEMI